MVVDRKEEGILPFLALEEWRQGEGSHHLLVLEVGYDHQAGHAIEIAVEVYLVEGV